MNNVNQTICFPKIEEIESDPIGFLTSLGFQHLKLRGSYVSGLPICHGDSDNFTGFCFYLNTRRWFCFTHGCHEKYGADLIGLISAVTKVPRNTVFEGLKSQIVVPDVIDPVQFAVKKLKKYTQPPSVCQPLPDEIVESILINSSRANFLESRGFGANVCKRFPCFFCNIYPLKQRFIFPLTQYGKIVGFSGRKEEDNTDRTEPKWKHFNIHQSDFLFNWDNAVASGEKRVYITEGILDALSLIEAGYDSTIALMGTSCSSYNEQRIMEHFDEIAACLDNDDAGRKGTARLKARFNWGRAFFDYTPTEAKDYGELTGEEIRSIFEERLKNEKEEEN